MLLRNTSKDWPAFPGKASHTRIQIISAYLVQACLHVTLFSLEVQCLCSMFHCSQFFQSELWQKKNQRFVSLPFSTSGQMLMQETFLPQNCLGSAFRLISDTLPVARRNSVGGLEADWWSNRKGMEHMVVGAAFPTELQHFSIFSCWPPPFFLTAGSGKERQWLCLQEVAKHCLEGCLPIFSATLVLQLCVAGKVEPCKALAVIHWGAAKL